MNILEWAKREVEIASQRERSGAEKEEEPNLAEYGVGCYNGALKAFRIWRRNSGTHIENGLVVYDFMLNLAGAGVIDIPADTAESS